MQRPAPRISMTVEIDDRDGRVLVAAALSGPGGLAGVTRCEEHDGGLAIEVDPSLTPLDLVVRVIDIELARAAAGRRIVTGELPRATAAKICAAGVGDPAIDERRILEFHLD